MDYVICVCVWLGAAWGEWMRGLGLGLPILWVQGEC